MRIYIDNYNDLIFSSIEKLNLTQLKKILIEHRCKHERNGIDPIPKYRFETIDSFDYRSWSIHLDPVVYSFEFNDLKKKFLLGDLFSVWMNFILNNKKLKIFKTAYLQGNWRKNCESAIAELTKLPELEKIIVEHHGVENHEILKTILGSEWKPIEMKKTWRMPPHSFKSEFQRIIKKN